MSERIRWGILATGGIAASFVSDLRVAGLEVTAVGSRTGESAERFAAQHGIPRAHGSYELLAADPDVDVVYIATPHSVHAEAAILCLEHGKHVLVEKAFTLDRAQAEAVASAAAERGLVAQEAMWTRFLPHMRRLHELIDSGALGEVTGLIADHQQKLPDDPRHRLNDAALGGGALLDLGIYPISFAWDLFGAPATVDARSVASPTGVDLRTAVLFGYESGALATLQFRMDAAGPNTASVVGTRARVDLDAVWFSPTSFTVTAADGTVLERYESVIEGRGMQFQAVAVEEAIRAGRSSAPELPIEQTVAIMGSLDAVRERIGLRLPGAT